MATDEISFGPGGGSGPAAGERLGWQAPLVLVVALLVLLGAVAGGVALGRQQAPDSDDPTGGQVLSPYYAWSDLMSALSDPAVPPEGASAAAYLVATRAYVD